MVIDRDEVGRRPFDNECALSRWIGANDADIVRYCSDCLTFHP